MRRLILWFATLAVLFAVLSETNVASAQSIGLPARFTRTHGFRGNSQTPLYINRADCLADDELTFPVNLAGYQQLGLQVWASAGTDCTDATQRQGSAAQCWLVYNDGPTTPRWNVIIKARDIVAQHYPIDTVTDGSTGGASGTGGTDGTGGTAGTGGTDTGGTGGTTTVIPSSGIPNPGTIESCDNPQGSTNQPVTLFFMFVRSNQIQGTAQQYTGLGFDIDPPVPPTNVTATPGDTRLNLAWTVSSSSDLVQYNFYCDPPKGTVFSDAGIISASFNPGLSTLAVGDASVADSGAVGGATGVGGADAGSGAVTGAPGPDAGATGGATSTGGSSSTGEDTTCQGVHTTLIAGASPPEEPAYQCGKRTSTTVKDGIASGLVNEHTYAVAVAGVDKVGNVGKLSNVTCQQPVQITDFFELYKGLGGGGGGGFCSFSRITRAPTVPPLVAGLCLGLVGLGLLRRRGGKNV